MIHSNDNYCLIDELGVLGARVSCSIFAFFFRCPRVGNLEVGQDAHYNK